MEYTVYLIYLFLNCETSIFSLNLKWNPDIVSYFSSFEVYRSNASKKLWHATFSLPPSSWHACGLHERSRATRIRTWTSGFACPQNFAGPRGIEPLLGVLETPGLPLTYGPISKGRRENRHATVDIIGPIPCIPLLLQIVSFIGLFTPRQMSIWAGSHTSHLQNRSIALYCYINIWKRWVYFTPWSIICPRCSRA